MFKLGRNLLNDFKRRREYKIIKLYILKQCKCILKELKLPSIKILFNKHYDNCCFCSKKRILEFGLTYLYSLKYKKVDSNIVPVDCHFYRIYYVICHEISHYLQYHKYHKWHSKYALQYQQMKQFCSSDEEYKNLKIERNANKIASVLLKKYRQKYYERNN